MRMLPFYSDHGATAACTLRLILGAAHSGQATRIRQQCKVATGDSWFGSVKVAEASKLSRKAEAGETATFDGYVVGATATPNKGHEFIGAVKTNTGWYPKDEIETKMKDWPSGSYLVMESTAPITGVKLVAIGYRYNARKTLCFVMTKDAGSTLPGTPYMAKFPDQCGNVVERKVTRPQALSFFFETSNLMDAHNHARQYLLALERHWKTPNPWFRNVTTIIGMTVIDCWKALKHRMPQLHGNMSVEEYADCLAFDCYNNGYQKNAAGTAQGDIAADGIASKTQTGLPNFLLRPVASLADGLQDMTVQCCGIDSASPLTVDSNVFSFGRSSSKVNRQQCSDHDAVQQRAKDGAGEPAKRRCVMCGFDTRNECSNGSCKAHRRHYNGVSYVGVPICSTKANVRNNIPKLGLKNNTKSCLQLHRAQCRGAQEQSG